MFKQKAKVKTRDYIVIVPRIKKNKVIKEFLNII